jgi:hypothetical protein
MADSTVNNQVLNSINTVQQATMQDPVIKTSGAGKAYQMVAQSTALAIQDATDNLRNLSTVSTTAIGAAIAQYLATGEKKYSDAIATAQNLVGTAAGQFKTIGEDAADVLNGFPAS